MGSIFPSPPSFNSPIRVCMLKHDFIVNSYMIPTHLCRENKPLLPPGFEHSPLQTNAEPTSLQFILPLLSEGLMSKCYISLKCPFHRFLFSHLKVHIKVSGSYSLQNNYGFELNLNFFYNFFYNCSN